MTGPGWIMSLMLAGLTMLAACAGRGVPQPIAPASAHNGRMEVRLGDGAAQALLTSSGQNGTVTTWQSADRVSVSCDAGILVATRGLGEDLMSADVAGTRAFLQGHGAAEWSRLHSYLDGDYRTLWRGFRCTGRLAPDRDSRLRQRIEACYGPAGRFTNRYWQDARGVVVRSRQWVGPTLGYLDTDLQREKGQ